MGLTYIGIDEAGYGPMLGPLCVGMAAFRISDWNVSNGAPDLWDLLAPVACRSARETGLGRRGSHGRPAAIAFADSKVLKLSNSGARHPLLHLERGVLSMLTCTGRGVTSEDELLRRIGATLESHPWYEGGESPLPVAHSNASLAIDSNRLAGALSSGGVEFLGLRCKVVGERQFNACVRDSGTKAQTTLNAIGELTDWALNTFSADQNDIRIVCDRLGGRARYQEALAGVLPGRDVTELGWSASKSAYRIGVPGAGGGETAIMHLETEAEQAHLPVALASMLAKYVRELLMGRLNRYWGQRLSDIKPTAGYVTDARRWLAEVAEVMTPEERAAMVRIA